MPLENALVHAGWAVADLGCIHHLVPFILTATTVGLSLLPPVGNSLIEAASLFCIMILAPLAEIVEIAPPFVTRVEVNWRNRNCNILIEPDVAWEEVLFRPPVMKRIRSTTRDRGGRGTGLALTMPLGGNASNHEPDIDLRPNRVGKLRQTLSLNGAKYVRNWGQPSHLPFLATIAKATLWVRSLSDRVVLDVEAAGVDRHSQK